MNDRILAVVVSYNPSPSALLVSVAAIASQVERVLLVDNASLNSEELEETVATIENCEVRKLGHNGGLGEAHNIGIEYARANTFDYVLLLDQDSVALDGMVARLLAAHKVKSAKGKVSATGVTYLNADNGSESFFVRFGWLKFQRQYCSHRDADGCVTADFLISSGSLISLKTIEQVGVMDESLFIDHVDTEWFLRAGSKGFSAYGVCDAVMQHGLGETTHQINFGRGRVRRTRNVPQHKSFRYYYIFIKKDTLPVVGSGMIFKD
jgi:rhamnosyltransferase